jgi:hypothetical protein
MSILYTITSPDPCFAALPRHQDVVAATQPRPETDPAAGADALAIRCDRLADRAIRWATYTGEALQVIARLRAVAIDRASRLSEARREAEQERLRAEPQARRIDRLVESMERDAARENDLRREIAALRSALREQEREQEREAADRRRARQQERIAAACRAVQGEDDLTPQIRTGLRAMVGASTSVQVTLVTKGKPRLTGEPGHHLTEAGEICQHPGAYQRAYGRTTYVPSSEEITVSAAWIRTHAPTVAKAAMS